MKNNSLGYIKHDLVTISSTNDLFQIIQIKNFIVAFPPPAPHEYEFENWSWKKFRTNYVIRLLFGFIPRFPTANHSQSKSSAKKERINTFLSCSLYIEIGPKRSLNYVPSRSLPLPLKNARLTKNNYFESHVCLLLLLFYYASSEWQRQRIQVEWRSRLFTEKVHAFLFHYFMCL